MVGDGAFSHKIYCVTIYVEILNLEGHPNCITGSRVTIILMNVWILPIIGGASAVEGLRSTGLPGLVSKEEVYFLIYLTLVVKGLFTNYVMRQRGGGPKSLKNLFFFKIPIRVQKDHKT